MSHGDWAWITIAVGVVTYEIMAPPGQLLSEACHRYKDRHPWATALIVGYLATHLLRVWPAPIDPLHQLASRLGRR